MTPHHHVEHHRIHRLGWLRAAVLGANDGILSTASLILGVAAARADPNSVLLAAVAGLVAGAVSMAAGEFVSVSSQVDIERADLSRERRELIERPEGEKEELTQIYIARGLERELASRVASDLTAHDALGAHARDELGLTDTSAAQPIQAALASAASFAAGGALPLLVVLIVAPSAVIMSVSVSTLVALVTLGALSARAGGTPVPRAAARIAFWGMLSMALTTAVGTLFGVAV